MNRTEATGLALLGASVALAACGGGGGGAGTGGSAGPLPPASAPLPASFTDHTHASGIAYRVGITSPPMSAFPEILVAESTFGGAAAGDCDGDGDIDLFVTYGDSDIYGNGPGGPNRLYRNQLAERGDGLVFVDTAAASGVAYTRRHATTGAAVGNDRHSGPVFVDMDGDGDLDLFVGGIFRDPSRIYQNRGDCTFDDVTADSPELGAMLAANTISAAFGDYDLDGDLDMFLTHWGTHDSTYGRPRVSATDHLWQNVSASGRIRFVNVSEESGVSGLIWTTRAWAVDGTQDVDYTFTPSFARIDADPWPDILIAADFGTSQAFIGNGDGATFRSLGNPVLRDAQNGMGSAVGDFDNDGDLDWFVTSIDNPDAPGPVPIWGNRLFRNDATALVFADISDDRGVADGEWGWGACFLDIDNDGDLDLFHVNGWALANDRDHNHDFSGDRSRAYMARGNGRFVDEAGRLGIDDARNARGVVCADFDEDGDFDLLVLSNARGNSALLWRNDSAAAGSNYLRLRLAGAAPNTQAIGARIFVTVNGTRQMREVMAGGNYIAQNPTVQIYGLGAATSVESIRVEWPAINTASGIIQPFTLIEDPADARLRPSVRGETLVLAHPGF